jgi:hypothetical protein
MLLGRDFLTSILLYKQRETQQRKSGYKTRSAGSHTTIRHAVKVKSLGHPKETQRNVLSWGRFGTFVSPYICDVTSAPKMFIWTLIISCILFSHNLFHLLWNDVQTPSASQMHH